MTDNLNTDKELQEAYIANIAMAFMDSWAQYSKETGKKVMNRADRHTIANNAARYFIELLCNPVKESESNISESDREFCEKCKQEYLTTLISTDCPNCKIESDCLLQKWNQLNDEEKWILGRPNFTLAKIAHRMRTMGFEVDTKSEAEQALSIFTMLQFYHVYGSDWTNKMEDYLKNGK